MCAREYVGGRDTSNGVETNATDVEIRLLSTSLCFLFQNVEVANTKCSVCGDTLDISVSITCKSSR